MRMFAQVPPRFQYTLRAPAMRVVAAIAFSVASLLLSPHDVWAEEVGSSVGVGANALPGIGRVGVAAPRAPLVLTAAADAGYAFTEAQRGESGAHHRGLGSLAIGVQPLRFLSASLELDGQLDAHPADVLGSHTTVNGQPRLAVRAAEAVARSVALGAELDWRVPGAELPSIEPGSSTLDAKLLATFAPPGTDTALALNAGYRVDRSADLVDRPTRLRQGDRIALDASAFDAVLLGAGASRRFGALEVLGALTWDVLVGARAPSPVKSPLIAGLGARYQLTDDVQGQALAEVALSRRPGTQPFDPLAPIPPRFALTVGIRFAKGPPKPAPPPPRPDEPLPSATEPPAPVATTVSIRGRVKGDDGQPLAGATVSVGDKSVATAADGSFVLSDLPPGRATVTIKAPGYDDRTMDVDPAVPADVVVKHAIKPGELRGVVRMLPSGKPVVNAVIRIEPLGTEEKTDADGAFKVQVPPGTYEVVITAPGLATQKRKMQVGENGVTILNADLRPGGP